METALFLLTHWGILKRPVRHAHCFIFVCHVAQQIKFLAAAPSVRDKIYLRDTEQTGPEVTTLTGIREFPSLRIFMVSLTPSGNTGIVP
jgi:hypothetical protein